MDNNWISVNKRLPKHCEVVMIPCDDNPLGMKMAQFMEHGISDIRKGERNFFCHASEWGFDDYHIYYGVKAWLPLPKPSKELMPNNNRQVEYLDYSSDSKEDNDNKHKFVFVREDGTAIQGLNTFYEKIDAL